VTDQQPPGWTPPQEPPRREEPPTEPPTWPPPPAAGESPPPPPGYSAPPGQYGGYQPYGYPGYAPARKTDGNAIAALVLAIASWVVCPVVLAIVALFFASTARKNIEASNGMLEGEGLVTAARVVAWINIGLAILAIIAIIVVAIVLAATDSTTSSSGVVGVYRWA
jgi:hypothetical protein